MRAARLEAIAGCVFTLVSLFLLAGVREQLAPAAAGRMLIRDQGKASIVEGAPTVAVADGQWRQDAAAASEYTTACAFVAETTGAVSNCYATRQGYRGFGATFDTGGGSTPLTLEAVKRAFGGRTVALIGDSLSRQQFASLACTLMGIHDGEFCVAVKEKSAGFWGAQACIGFPGARPLASCSALTVG